MRQHASTAALVSDDARLLFDGKLIVFTSFYDYRGHAAYTQSMVALAMQLERLGVKWDYWPVQGDFHIERCVNQAFTRFYDDPEATHMLCIDSDESFDPNAVLRMLSHNVEIIAGAYKMKNNWGDWTARWLVNKDNGHPVGRVIDAEKKQAILEAHRIPWGFTLFAKSALQKYVQKFPEAWGTYGGEKAYVFCEGRFAPEPAVGSEREWFSQDYGMSERMKEAGVTLWIDPDVTIGHWGNTEHIGNLRTHLIQLAETQAEAKKVASQLGGGKDVEDAFATVRQMARQIEERKAA